MFIGKRSKLAAVLLSMALGVSSVCPPTADAHNKDKKEKSKAAAKAAASNDTSEWTEKERIGQDVPMESWRDSKLAPWAALLCVHGLGLHNTSYEPFGKRMADLGVATYAMDVRGFGSWQNTNENRTVDFAAALTDINAALAAVHKAHPKIPVVLLGESMGGALAIQATAMDESLVDGLIACVPSGMRHGEKITTMKVALGLVRGRHKPLKIGNKIINQATDDPDLRAEWKEDPAARLTMSPQELLKFQNFMDKNIVRAKQITQTPVLFVQGGSDRLVKTKGNVDLFKDIKSPDKDFVLLGTSEHLIFEEGQFDQHVIDVVSSWLEKHVAQEFAAKMCHPPEGDHEKAYNQAAGRLLLAQGYIKLEDYPNALQQLKQALELGQGSKFAQDARELMAGLPVELIAPKTGPATKVWTSEIKFTSHEGAMENDKPSVLVFCANWVKPCKDLDQPLKTLYDQYGDKVNFVHIDADDPNSQNLVKKYGIGPLPAVLYLSGKNEVMSYTLGVSDEAGMRKEVMKLVGTTAHAD